ncbi:EAL domain-containing protein [Yokenella regensburgei]|uniref:EAL domain-containing protein n=1 Tax=Yokenella regensburgei TaxID=158877 RepID=UPI003F159F3C
MVNFHQDLTYDVPGKSKSLIMRTFIILVPVVIGVFIAAISSLFYISEQVNFITDRHDSFLITHAFEKRQSDMRSHLQDNAEWGEAYVHLHNKVDTTWAWDSQNLGKSIFDNFGYEGVFVVSHDEKTNYSVINGKLVSQDLKAWLGDEALAADLFQRVNKNNGKTVSYLAITNSVLSIVSAAWIVPGEDNRVSYRSSVHSYLIFVDRLTPEKLKRMGEEIGVNDIRIINNAEQNFISSQRVLSLNSAAGRISVGWNSENPGKNLLVVQMPLLFIIMLLTVILLLLLLRHLIKKAKAQDEKTKLLWRTRLALQKSEERFRDASEITSDWLWESDAHLTITWISDKFSTVTGLDKKDWIGKSLGTLFPEQQNLFSNWYAQEQPPHCVAEHCRYFTKDNHTRICTLVAKKIVLENGAIGFRGAATDITDEVEAIKRIHYLSFHDELTGLPNRHQIKEHLNTHISNLQNSPFALISIDLDKFKPVNDLFGHAAGDALLAEVSVRLQRCLRKCDLVARQGGDEFLVVLSAMDEIHNINDICARIVEALNHPFVIEGNEISVGVSMGVTLAPEHGTTSTDLLRYADIALYRAKQTGRNKWVLYHPDMYEEISERRQLEIELRSAIHNNQLFLVYQPRYNACTNRIEAVEALVRWRHPQKGIVMPDTFIPVAEDTGLIVDLSDWVLKRACTDAPLYFRNKAVSVNISAIEFSSGDLCSRIARIIAETGFDPHKLEIEVTENVILTDPDKTFNIMKKLKEQGVRFLIDDFGTGYASVSYLRKFHFDGIKLDKSFVNAMDESAESQNVVEKMIALGKAYSMEVTAEGVETEQQMNFLIENQCDVLQGYYISKPVERQLLDLSFRR